MEVGERGGVGAKTAPKLRLLIFSFHLNMKSEVLFLRVCVRTFIQFLAFGFPSTFIIPSPLPLSSRLFFQCFSVFFASHSFTQKILYILSSSYFTLPFSNMPHGIPRSAPRCAVLAPSPFMCNSVFQYFLIHKKGQEQLSPPLPGTHTHTHTHSEKFLCSICAFNSGFISE